MVRGDRRLSIRRTPWNSRGIDTRKLCIRAARRDDTIAGARAGVGVSQDFIFVLLADRRQLAGNLGQPVEDVGPLATKLAKLCVVEKPLAVFVDKCPADEAGLEVLPVVRVLLPLHLPVLAFESVSLGAGHGANPNGDAPLRHFDLLLWQGVG